MPRIIVASTNPIKIATTKLGFKKMFPNLNFKIEGISAPSGVPDQPMGERQTRIGAINRAKNAFNLIPHAHFWVGIEGGMKEVKNKMETFAWIAVKSKKGKISKSRTGSFYVPAKVADLVKQGKELGEADDIVFGLRNSKQSNGAIGILTNNVLTRASFYEIAIITALIPFKNPHLY